MTNVIKKECTRCHIEKHLSEFYKSLATFDDHTARCKACIWHKNDKTKAYQKAYRQSENGKSVKKYYNQSENRRIAQKVYSQSEQARIAQKAYRQSEKGKAYNKAYREAHKEERKAYREKKRKAA